MTFFDTKIYIFFLPVLLEWFGEEGSCIMVTSIVIEKTAYLFGRADLFHCYISSDQTQDLLDNTDLTKFRKFRFHPDTKKMNSHSLTHCSNGLNESY